MARFVVDLAALIWPVIAVDAQSVALEVKRKTQGLNYAVLDLLANQMMDEEGAKPICVRVVASNHPGAVDMLKVTSNIYAANFKSKIELPVPEGNLIELLTNKELQF